MNVCLLGCGGLAEDSIEHYARCRAVRAVANSSLRLGRTLTIDIDHFMLSSDDLRDMRGRAHLRDLHLHESH